jgi:hypothetical protein
MAGRPDDDVNPYQQRRDARTRVAIMIAAIVRECRDEGRRGLERSDYVNREAKRPSVEA